MAKQKNIKVTFLGGVGEIGKNMTVIEYGDDMIIADCGQEFGKDDSPGIDAIIPDITYVRENKSKLKAIVLTHGHEDHIGAIQYYADDFKSVPIYGTALTLGLVERKLKEAGRKLKLKKVDEGEVISAGCFNVEFVKVAHSMAGACALAITTPLGVIFDTGDFKFDSTAIDGKNTNLQRIAQIGSEGVLLMLGESTNVERKGHSSPEKAVGQALENIFLEYTKKRIIITTFASSNYRVQQILWLAKKYNRKVVLAGRSMKGIVETAESVGELEVPKGVLVDSVGNLRPEQTLVIATGSQGEPMSALNKMSINDFNKLTIGEEDVVVFSSSPIPGNEKSVYDVINNLYRQGAEVIYDAMNEVHVSGHAYEEELKTMLSLVKPQFFMPIHGEYRHQFKHAQLASVIGIPKCNMAIPNIGDSWAVNQKGLKKMSNVTNGNVYVDNVVLEDGYTVVSERRSLAEYGMIVILAAVDAEKGIIVGDPEIISRGFNLTDDIQREIKRTVTDTINAQDNVDDLNELIRTIKKAVRKLFYRSRSFPVIVPVLIND